MPPARQQSPVWQLVRVALLRLLLWPSALAAVEEPGWCGAPWDGGEAMIRPRFVLFGDSLTQRSFDEGGWGARLASSYQRKVDVINRGYSGYTSRWVQPMLKDVFPDAWPPLLATVFFGANDAAMADRASSRQHVPLNEYKQNLESIVAHLKAAGVAHIVLITPPPLDEQARIRDMQERHNAPLAQLPERTNEVTGQYAAVVREVAANAGVLALDLFTGMQQEAGWEARYLNDGLHFTPAGQAKLYDLLQAVIDAHIPQLRVDELPFDFPLHGDMPSEGFADVIAQHKRR